MNNKYIIFVIKCVLSIIIIIGSILSCSYREKEIPYEEQFNLKRFKLKQFDLYNPILHEFKLDPIKRSKHPDYFDYDVYYDENDVIRYSYFRSDSYGYLQEFTYNDNMNLDIVKIYPISTAWIDRNAKVFKNKYYYFDGELKLIKDDLNNELILFINDNVFLYEGITEFRDSQFNIKKIDPQKYFILFFH